MKNVKLKEITISNARELSNSIEKALLQCKDMQIFVADALFKRFVEENKRNIIWREWVVDSFHYSDNVEEAFIFFMKNNKEMKTFQMHVVKNCVGYRQLTFFASKGILYKHYGKGMKTILIINSD